MPVSAKREDAVTYFHKIVMFFDSGKQIDILNLSSYNCSLVRS